MLPLLLSIGLASVACGPFAALDDAFESVARSVEARGGQHEPDEAEMDAAPDRVRQAAVDARQQGVAPDPLAGLSRAQPP